MILVDLKRGLLLKLHWVFEVELFTGDRSIDAESTQENIFAGEVICKLRQQYQEMVTINGQENSK